MFQPGAIYSILAVHLLGLTMEIPEAVEPRQMAEIGEAFDRPEIQRTFWSQAL